MEKKIADLLGFIYLAFVLIMPFLSIKSLLNLQLYYLDKLKFFFKSPVFYLYLAMGLAYLTLAILMLGPFIGININPAWRGSVLQVVIYIALSLSLYIFSRDSLTAAVFLCAGSCLYFLSLVWGR